MSFPTDTSEPFAGIIFIWQYNRKLGNVAPGAALPLFLLLFFFQIAQLNL